MANVAAIGLPKMAYPDVEENKSSCYLATNMYGYICLTGSRKFVNSVIIWKQYSAFGFVVL